MPDTFVERLTASFATHADRAAVHAGAVTLSYAELWARAAAVAGALEERGIGRGHRVALWMEKSPDALAVLLGTLLAGATYVPVDPRAPLRRALYQVTDCEASALAVDRLRASHLPEFAAALPALKLRLESGEPPLAEPPREARAVVTPRAPRRPPIPEDPAWILYTSGSTGRPKGVVLSHRAGLGFVDWCTRTFAPRPEDRMTSHAPFHFDLSTFDLFVTLTSGASVRLLDSTAAMLAPWLARQLPHWGITVWYSVPAALAAMLEAGGWPDGWPQARLVLFAGEVFPTPQLQRLAQTLPHPRLYNLYGPTETNVCTYYEVRGLPPGESRPIPIGRVCEQLDGAVLDDSLREVPPGEEGDLWIGGPNLFSGYWKDPDLTRSRLRDDPRPGRAGMLYDTGDRVKLGADGDLHFLGRRDHMVKVRGYRVELGEIESVLHDADGVAEVAVAPMPAGGAGHQLVAFVVVREDSRPDEAALRRHLGERLPLYMVPERFVFLPRLPRTSTGKVDRVSLTEQAQGGEAGTSGSPAARQSGTSSKETP